MKDCIKVKRLLSRYLDKETGEAETNLVETHLNSCPLCKKELLEFSRVKELVSGKERMTLPENYLVSRLREEISRQERHRKRLSLIDLGNLSRRLIPIPVATIVLSLLFLLLISAGPKVSKSSLADNLLSGTPVTTEAALGLILGGQDLNGGDLNE